MSKISLTKDNFEAEVLKCDLPVVVDFYADWCGPCMTMGPILEAFASEFEGKYKVGAVNVDKEPELSETYRVMSIPTIKVFKNGKITANAVGTRSVKELLEMVNM